MATKPKKARKVSAYSKKVGRYMKQGMSMKAAHRAAKKGTRKVKRKKKSAGGRVKRKASKTARKGRKMARMKKIQVLALSAVIPPMIVGAAEAIHGFQNPEGGGLSANPISNGLRGLHNGLFGSYHSIVFDADFKPHFQPERLMVGWAPLVAAGVGYTIKRMLGFKNPSGLPWGV